MSDSSFIDRLPSREREKIRKRLRSPEAYERLREKVKGPEDLEREMQRSERLAELRFAMETEPKAKETAKAQVQEDIREKGIDAVIENAEKLSPGIRSALEQGKFALAVSAHPTTREDALLLVPEGDVQEKLPVKPSYSERYAGSVFKTNDKRRA